MKTIIVLRLYNLLHLSDMHIPGHVSHTSCLVGAVEMTMHIKCGNKNNFTSVHTHTHTHTLARTHTHTHSHTHIHTHTHNTHTHTQHTHTTHTHTHTHTHTLSCVPFY